MVPSAELLPAKADLGTEFIGLNPLDAAKS